MQVLHRGGWSLRLASDSLRAAEELTTAIVNVICAARSGIARYLSPGARHAFEPPGLLAQPLRCRYAVGEELRRGTYGAVLRGRCLQSCREVALKQLALKPAQGGTGQRDSPTRQMLREDVHREVAILRELREASPHVVTLPLHYRYITVTLPLRYMWPSRTSLSRWSRGCSARCKTRSTPVR